MVRTSAICRSKIYGIKKKKGLAIGKGINGECAAWSGPNGEVCFASDSGELLEVLDQQVRLEKHIKGGSVFKDGRFIYSLEE